LLQPHLTVRESMDFAVKLKMGAKLDEMQKKDEVSRTGNNYNLN